MNPAPQIPGYDLGQRLLQHPLAEIWRGRSRTGLEVVAIVLSDAGAADPRVRERLDHASRGAALEPGRSETPLWAANLTAARPYAITQLIPGQSGAERLLDPLDGVFGNDQASVAEVRRQLQQFGAAPVPTDGRYAVQAAASGSAGSGFLAEFRRRAGWRFYPGLIIGGLFLFSVSYSAGAAFTTSEANTVPPSPAPPPPAVSPAAMPSPVVLPGISKLPAARLQPVPQIPVVGASYDQGVDAQPVGDIGLPFAFRWPSPPGKIILGESSYSIYRRVISGEDPRAASLDAEIAVHPCKDLAACVAERAAFDQRWTQRYKAPVPATAKDPQTWFTEQKAGGGKPYSLSMTRAFRSGDQWWLVGVVVAAKPGDEAAAQRVLNDIRTQTS